MDKTITTPNWLKIDDSNFNDLLEYLGKNAKNKDADPFYSAAMQLLRQRVDDLIPTMAADLAADEKTLIFRIRLLGAWLLCFPEESEQQNIVLFCFLNCLSQIVPEASAEKLFQLSLDSILSGTIQSVGLVWNDLIDLKKELLAHKIGSALRLTSSKNRELWFEGKGALKISGNKIRVMPANRSTCKSSLTKLDDCMGVADDKICVSALRDEKLKQSESSDISALEKFSLTVRRNQRNVKPSSSNLKKYNVDQEVVVRVTDNAGRLAIETADPTYEKISGTLHHPKGLFYYSETDFEKALHVGDCFKAVIVDKDKGRFSVYEAFQNDLLSLVEENKSYPAEYLSEHKEGSLWMTNEGVPVYVKEPGNFNPGDHAYLCIDLVGGNGYVRAIIDEDQSGIEEEDFNDSKVWFIKGMKLDYTAPEVSAEGSLDSDFVKILERSLYNYQKTLSRPSEIYKILCMCQILSELTEDERELHYLELKADYLEQLVLFARGQYPDMKSLSPSSDIAGEQSIIRSVQIVDILKEIVRIGNSELLSDTIQSSNDPMMVKIARILQSYNCIKDLVPEAVLTDLKQEVVHNLSLEIEYVSALEEDNDEYLGQEDKIKEFKTSFVYPADKSQHMLPNIHLQSRAVFRGVCAFLNSSVGGTLYLGVSDLGYVTGLDNDLSYLKCNMDGYIRLIQNEASEAFDKSILDFLDFELMFEGRVLAIHVKAFDDGIVCMDGIPYKRNYGQSIPMHEDEKTRVIAAKVVTGLKAGSKIEAIERAIKERRRTVFKRFSSSSGIDDRKVEPFSLSKDRKYVWCYDIEDKAVKQFRISGMAAVEVLQETWTFQNEHKIQQTDIFHWSGDKTTHIEWEMDLTAKNILCDEYQEAAEHVKQIDKEGKVWSFSADVYQMIAPCRFYIGLLDHINLTKGEELKKYVADYVKKYIGK